MSPFLFKEIVEVKNKDNGHSLVCRSHEVSLEEDIKFPVVIRYKKNFGGHEKSKKSNYSDRIRWKTAACRTMR